MRMNVENLHYVFCTWVLAQGWKPTQYSVEAMLAADPKGYYLLFKDGSPIASISAVCDSNTKNAHIGLFIVIEPYQGKGFGKILWEAVVAKLLQEGYTVSLNAVPSGTRADQTFYEKLGFKAVQLDEVWQYVDLKPNVLLKNDSRKYADSHLDAIVSYDSKIYGEPRKAFLEKWLTKANTEVYFSIDTEENDKITGYGVISDRASAKTEDNVGCRIGPLYADNSQIAEELLNVLLGTTEKRPVMFDLPGSIVKFGEVLSKIGFEKAYSMVCMSNPPRNSNDKSTFAKTSLASYKR